MKNKISVIIPTYNRQYLLERALHSVFHQSLPAAEIIVIDDGSTDGSAELIPSRFPGVCYIRQEHRGVSHARNHGIEKATGEWIAFLDSDDEWLPKKLEAQVKALRENPRYRICHTDEIWIRRGRRVNPKKKHAKHGGYIFQHCLPLCIISPSSVMIHRSVFDDVGLFDESLPACEDYDMWLRICSRYPVLYIDTPLIIKYGGHSDQLSQQFWGMDRFRIYALEKILKTGIPKREDEHAARKILQQKISIYIQGAKKRGKDDEVEYYRQKLTHYGTKLLQKHC